LFISGAGGDIGAVAAEMFTATGSTMELGKPVQFQGP